MDPSSTISFQLHSLVYIIDKLADSVLKENTSLSFPQFLIILCIQQNPLCTQKYIAEWLNITEATVSYMIKNLKKAGYVLVSTDPTDHRQRHVNNTKKGQDLIDFIYPLLEESLSPHFMVINAKDLIILQRSIEAIHLSLGKKECNE
jgi:DNA-binding MarR family transcriptional regulator